MVAAEFHQDTWNHCLMIGYVSVQIPCNTISNLGQQWSHTPLHGKLMLPSASTLSNISSREYSLKVDAIKKQLLSRNQVSLRLDGWTSTNKRAITSVIAYCMDQNLALGEVQLAFDEVDRILFPYLKSQLRIIGHGSTYWSMASQTYEESS